MKIQVCNPPAYILNNERHWIQAGSRWSFSMDAPKGNHKFPHYQPYPFSLGYAVSMLRLASHEVDAFDGCALDMDEKEWLARIEQFSPDFLVTEVPTVSFPLVMYLLSEIQKQVGCKIVVAGSHVTAFPQSVPEEYFKACGEWETQMPLAVKSKNFAEYPPPDRQFFPNEQYSNFEFQRPSAQMLASRACPHSCSFCLERHVMGYSGGFSRFRSAKKVVNEMEHLQSLGARQIHFDDMNLPAYKNHIEAICTEILGRNLDLPWTCLGDILTDEATILLMADSGCIGYSYGVETINPRTAQLINKPHVTPEKVTDFTALLDKYHIHSVPTYQIGLPEKKEDMQRTIDFAFNLQSNSLQFSIATPLPDSPFYKLCEREGWLRTKDWTQYDGARHSVTDYPWINHAEVEELYRYAMQRRKDEERGFRKNG
jgi:anaerobic magnesium-protoporphyrin IX monomethyl ester cyclase